MNKKQPKITNPKPRPAHPDTFGEIIAPRPHPPQASTPHDDLGRPTFHEHDEFGEWLLRDA